VCATMHAQQPDRDEKKPASAVLTQQQGQAIMSIANGKRRSSDPLRSILTGRGRRNQ
jgi:hypothetical protein